MYMTPGRLKKTVILTYSNAHEYLGTLLRKNSVRQTGGLYHDI